MPDRRSADFYIRYPDEVYLAQVREFVDNAARAAALATGTKVKIDHYGKDRDGISEASLAELGFAYMKKYGATNVLAEPGKPQGFEETGSVSRDLPGIGFSSQSSTAANHTYEMDADDLKEIGHHGFTVDARGDDRAALRLRDARRLPRGREEGVRRASRRCSASTWRRSRRSTSCRTCRIRSSAGYFISLHFRPA